jgi:type I restriction enzyme M protein
VSAADIAARGWNLDIKNPHRGEMVNHDPEVLLAEYRRMLTEIADLQGQLKVALAAALERNE